MSTIVTALVRSGGGARGAAVFTCHGDRTSVRSGCEGGRRGEERLGENSGTAPLRWGSGPALKVWAAGLPLRRGGPGGAWASGHPHQ